MALGLDAHDLRIEIADHRFHVIAIDRIEELLQYLNFVLHVAHSSLQFDLHMRSALRAAPGSFDGAARSVYVMGNGRT